MSYRDNLRYDFWYSCAYCSISEIEASAIGFEIYHYLPQKAFPKLKNVYENLMWACKICNQYKLDYCPDEKKFSNKIPILRPDKKDFNEHLKLNDLRLSGLTTQGEFTIELLYLNRRVLRNIRRIKQKYAKVIEYITNGIKELSLRIIDSVSRRNRRAYIKLREKLIGQSRIIEQAFDNALREFAHSPLIDTDPQKGQDLKMRKQYLEAQKIIGPEVFTGK